MEKKRVKYVINVARGTTNMLRVTFDCLSHGELLLFLGMMNAGHFRLNNEEAEMLRNTVNSGNREDVGEPVFTLELTEKFDLEMFLTTIAVGLLYIEVLE